MNHLQPWVFWQKWRQEFSPKVKDSSIKVLCLHSPWTKHWGSLSVAVMVSSWKKYIVQGSILLTFKAKFYAHRSLMLKKIVKSSVSFCAFGTWCQFHKHFPFSFYAHRSQKRKKYWQHVSIFCAFSTCGKKASGKMLMKLIAGSFGYSCEVRLVLLLFWPSLFCCHIYICSLRAAWVNPIKLLMY